MNFGAVAFIDVLGFKGIWEREEPSVILGKMAEMKNKIAYTVPRLWDKPEDVDIQIAFVSDGVFLSASRKTEYSEETIIKELQIAELVEGVALMSGVAALIALDSTPPLPCRGCVELGDFLISQEGGSVVGPAVDSVAENENLAEGAFIWFLPSARKQRISSNIEERRGHNETFPIYDVPLKNGQTYNTIVVNVVSLSKAFGIGKAIDTLRKMLESMDSKRLDVDIKKGNTLRFYKTVERELSASAHYF